MFLKKISKKPALKKALILLLAFSITGISTIKLKQYMESNRPTERVLVAATDIMPYTVITDKDLGYIQLPTGSEIPGSIQDPRQAIGKTAKITIFHGEQILPQKLADSPLVVQAGEREVAVPTDVIRAVGMTLKPGDKVDVYWLPKSNGNQSPNNNNNISQAQVVAHDATVIDLLNKNNTSVYSVAPQPSDNSNNSTDSSAPAVLILKVQDDQVQPVITAAGNGIVYLAKK